VSASGSTGAITLSLPQNIHTDATPSFNSLTLDTQGALTLLPYGTNAGETGETRFRELSANGSNYVAFRSPDNIPDGSGNVVLTLPTTDGGNNEVLVTDGSGNLSWQSVSGVGGLTGSGTSNSIARFTGTSTLGDSGLTDDGSVIGITRDISFTASTPSITITDGATLTINDGTNPLLTLADNGGTATLTVNALTIGGDTITEFVGTGLQIGSGTISTTLGTSVDLTSEVTGILPVANGGTGVNAGTASNGQLLIGNGTGFSLATITAGTGIGVTNASGAITIANTGVTSITGTSNQVSASGSTGAITLSLPQNIHSDATPSFNAVTLDTQAAITLLPFGTNAGETAETRFRELTANGSNFVSLKAPSSISDVSGDVTLTLPGTDGDNNQVLVTDGNGVLSWQSVSGVGGVTGSGTSNSLARFTGASTIGDSGVTDNGSVIGLTRDITFTATTPSIAITDGETLTISDGTNPLLTLVDNGGNATLSVNALTVGGDTITEFVGTGLQIGSGTISTTLGTSVDLTSEVTGILPVANGGTGVNGSTASNGQLLIGNGSGYTLATLTAGTGIGVTNAAGSITIANTGVTSITGTSNQVSASGSTGAITLSLPQNIHSDATPSFNSLTLDTQGALTLLPYGTSAGNTSETRFRELSANGSNYVAFRAPDNISDVSGNVTLTLPGTDGDNNQVLVTDGTGNLSWQSVSGVGGVTGSGTSNSIARFTGASTIGDSGLTDDGSVIGITRDLTFSAATPRITINDGETLTIHDGTSSLLTLVDNGSTATLTVNALTVGGDTINEFAGTGLQVSGNTLSATLGTSVDLTSEITGILPVANGGTGASSFTAGSIIFYDGTTFAENNTGLFWDETFASLGLGTTAPARALAVAGGINVDAGDANDGDLNQAIVFGDGGSSGEGISSKRTASGNQFGLDFYTAGLPRLQITNTGAIGMGTDAPMGYSALTVSRTDDPVISIEDVGNGVGYLATDGQEFIVASEANINLKTGVTFVDDGPIVSGDSRLYIDGATGFVGIGNTDPGTILDVSGDTYVRNQGDVRLGDADSSAFVALQAPATLGGDVTLTLPANDGDNNQVLITDGDGNLSWTSVSGVEAGDISAIGDVTSGEAFTSGGTQGTSLWFYDADGRGQLTIADLSAARTYTLPDTSGTFAFFDAAQTWTSAQTMSALLTLNGGLSMEAGDTFTFNGDAITDLTGTGLQLSGNSLTTTLGTSVDLTSEVTGILPVANGGTGVNGGSAANGQLLIGNGSGYSLATLTAGTGIGVTNGAGTISIDNTGVTSIAGTANQINASGSTGAVTLSLPQSIATTSSVQFGTLALGTTGSAAGTATLNASAAATGEIRFNELSGNGTNYIAFRAPNDLGSSNYTLTLPVNDGDLNQVLLTDGNGNLSWTTVSGIEAGDISAVGDISTGAAFTETAGNDGNSLYFEGSTANTFETRLTGSDVSADQTITLPDGTGTVALLSLAQTWSAAQTYSSLATFNSNILLGNQGEVRFAESGGANYFALRAAAAMDSDDVYTWPSDVPAGNNYALIAQTNGTLSWAEIPAISGVGDITAVGSMTGAEASGAVFAGAQADDDWLGLGASAGRIEFDDQTIDEVNILSAYLGIGTSVPTSQLHLSAQVEQSVITTLAQFDGYGEFGGLSTGDGASIDFRLQDDGGSMTNAAGIIYAWEDASNASEDSSLRFNTTVAGSYGERMRIDDGGRLGIGTTSPNALVEALATTEQLRLSYNGSNSTSFTVSSAGDLTIAPSGGDTSVTGNLGISGNTTLGDATGDTISFTGRVNTDILPSADDTYDLGSSANRWQDLYLGPTK
jgi:hypothetical protein